MLADDKGKMSAEKVKEQDHEMFKAATQGMSWKGLDWKCRVLYPKALDIIQKARNVGGHVQRQVSPIEGLGHLHRLAATAPASGKAVDWPSARKAIAHPQLRVVWRVLTNPHS